MLFRALLDAGADAVVAYTADQGIQSVVSGAVAAELQPFLLEMRRNAAADRERLAAFERRTDEIRQRTDEIKQRTDELARRTDEIAAEGRAAREVADATFDAIQRELRLIWGALGVMLGVQLATLGTLLAR